jgi:two-component system CheB/CheR fusion protein
MRTDGDGTGAGSAGRASEPGAEATAKTAPEARPRVTAVVGIGSSAGGLEALQDLLGGLGPTGRTAYVVAQHLSPHHPSALVDLLGPTTALRVVAAVDGMALEPDVVAVCPPQRDITVDAGVLRVVEPTLGAGTHPSVDALLRSIADAWPGRCTGVILSGTGSDGAHGLRAIRAAGGLTIVQDPERAKFAAMPRAAIAVGTPDMVLPAGEIGAQLRELSGLAAAPPSEEADEPGDLSDVVRTLRRAQGIDFAGHRQTSLMRQVRRRMALRRVDALGDYGQILAADSREQLALVGNLLVTVTSFFRDPVAFDALRGCLAEYVQARVSEEALRIWVPGCATGEEVYSLLMLVDGLLDHPADLARRVKVFGTDLDEGALAFARRALYPASALGDLPASLVAASFVERDDGFAVADRLRDCAVFARHDVGNDPPFPRLDLVSYRNTSIYFAEPMQARALDAVRFGLVPGGLLFLGQAEAVPAGAPGLVTLDAGQKVYARTSAAVPPSVRRGPVPRTRLAPVSARRSHVESVPDAVPVEHVSVLQAVARAFTGAALVVDARHDVVAVLGDVSPFCRLAEGQVSASLSGLLTPLLVPDARALLMLAAADGAPATGQPTLLPGSGTVRLTARPLLAADRPLTLLTFETIPGAGGDDADALAPRPVGYAADLERLEAELLRSQDSMAASLAELEGTNAELQAMAEELQGSSEELQGTNEELESTNEELRAAVEELVEVNAHLRDRGVEREQLLDDLENIEESVAQGVVVLDENLCVTRFSAAAARVFALVDADIGRPLLAVATALPTPGLEPALLAAVGGVAGGLELSGGDVAYLVRALPYEGLRGQRRGAILTLTDISERAAGERRSAELSAMFEAVFRNATFGAAVIGDDDRVLLASETLGEIVGRSADSLRGAPLSALTPVSTTDGAPEIPERVVRTVRPDGAVRWIRTSVRTLSVPVRDAAAVLVVEDVTDLHERTERLTEQAFYDSLTGLANRAATHELYRKAIVAAQTEGRRLALLWIDLDDFKEVNDRDGHAAGDSALREAAVRIGRVMRGSDLVGRLGGDEFAVLVEDVTSVADLDRIGGRLLAALRRPLRGSGLRATVTASVGIAIYPEDGADVEGLLRAADAAMYAAKANGGDGLAYFQASMNDRAEARRNMRATVAAALRGNDFELYYQPIVSGTDGSVWGAEALLRMHHDGAVVPAGQFIGFCEESGQIRALGPLTMALLRADVAALAAAGRPALRMCLNLSATQLEDSEFAAAAASTTLDGLPDLVVEVTESVFLPDNARATAQLAVLRAWGASVAIDDFGTGYSNLRLLLDLAPEAIKLDGSFLQHALLSDAEPLINAGVQMAHSIGATVVAEGVETDEARELVTRLGVDLLQGYGIARPMPLADLIEWLARR